VSNEFESLRGEIPGEQSRSLRTPLRAHESRNVTYLTEEFPVFWESASGATITDVDGNRYIDLTAAFGVANVGHANPQVVAALHDQATKLMHGMGDVHPTEIRTRLLGRLTEVLPSGLDKAFLATTGSEAVEAAMKTAVMATGKYGFVAYHGAYHGLSLGTLAISGIPKFREPFAAMLPKTTTLLDYPKDGIDDTKAALTLVRDVFESRRDLAALVIEPIQGRGGSIAPPPGYLPGLRALCDKYGVLLIFDEIYTGFGRTGTWFACQDESVTPDIICIGKAMGGGFPISAAVARNAIMDAWPESTGEALHTSTYIGNPMGCAAALATIDEIERMRLPERANALGERISSFATLGRGLLRGIQVADAATSERITTRALAKGIIVLPAGLNGDVISIAPPLTITEQQLDRAMDILKEAM
jgi:4-aminobutyrate aminotransferase-like enzyme